MLPSLHASSVVHCSNIIGSFCSFQFINANGKWRALSVYCTVKLQWYENTQKCDELNDNNSTDQQNEIEPNKNERKRRKKQK